MPNTKSAKKELRKGARRTFNNSIVKDDLDLVIKKVRKAITANNHSLAMEALTKALQTIDKAAKKGFMKANARDRKKSRLAKAVNKLKK